jgi:hypothetical protein
VKITGRDVAIAAIGAIVGELAWRAFRRYILKESCDCGK